MKYVDAHIHLQEDCYFNDLEDTLINLEKFDLASLFCASIKIDDFKKIQAASLKSSKIIPCFGFHPWYVDDVAQKDIERLEKIIQENKNALIGETGLDNFFNKSNKDKQVEVFKKHIDIAIKHKRPVICHILKAWDSFFLITKDIKKMPVFIMHSYSGGVGNIKKLYDMGAYFSYGYNILDDNNKKVINSLKNTPLERVLIETDAPFARSKVFNDFDNDYKKYSKNYEKMLNIKSVYVKASQIKGVSLNDFSNMVLKNANHIINGGQ